VIVRIWTTGVDPQRADEYREFAAVRSLPMFRIQEGFRGVLFTERGSQFAVISLWRDRAAVDSLETSPTYQETVAAILATGFLTDEQRVDVFEVKGGELTQAVTRFIKPEKVT